MSQQQSLNAFFAVKKRPADQHAAKRRKVLLEDRASSTTLPKVAKKEVSEVREAAKVVVKSHTDSESSSSLNEVTSIKVK